MAYSQNNSWRSTDIYGCLVREIPSFNDERGGIHKFIGSIGSSINIENLINWREVIVTTSVRSTIRGLHIPKSSEEGWKISSALDGEINDITFDLRENSPTYLKYQKINLINKNTQVIIPPGVAHGVEFIDGGTLLYATELSMANAAEVCFNPFSIDIWNINKSDAVLSEKDAGAESHDNVKEFEWNLSKKVKIILEGSINE